MSVIDELTEDQKQRLAKEAIDAAREAGYCDEAINVISNMGLKVEDVEVVITLASVITVPYGTNIDFLSIRTIEFEDEDGNTYEGYDEYIEKVEK